MVGFQRISSYKVIFYDMDNQEIEETYLSGPINH